jgi:hypothetical protein
MNDTSPPLEKRLTRNEAAILLGVTPYTMRTLESNGALHPIRYSKKQIFYKESELLHLREHGISASTT